MKKAIFMFAALLFVIPIAYSENQPLKLTIKADKEMYQVGQEIWVEFTLTNAARKTFETTPIATNYNRILIIGPNGQKLEYFNWKYFTKPPVLIKSFQSKTWKIDLAKILQFLELNRTGTYQIYWKVMLPEHSITSNTIIIKVVEKKAEIN